MRFFQSVEITAVLLIVSAKFLVGMYYSDGYEPIFFKLGLNIDTTDIYI